jgi:hypothetical protein
MAAVNATIAINISERRRRLLKLNLRFMGMFLLGSSKPLIKKRPTAIPQTSRDTSRANYIIKNIVGCYGCYQIAGSMSAMGLLGGVEFIVWQQ